MIEAKELIAKAEKIHNKNQLLDQMDGAMFLHLILGIKAFDDWDNDEIKRWGYLLAPYYITPDVFEEFGGIT